jgi:ubiquinone/menaquinone biosynthesis C-methylase UbiE
MDEWIPPAIRDSRYFVYPIYRLLYNKRDLSTQMHFKSIAHEFDADRMAKFYSTMDVVSRRRQTDLCDSHIKQILELMAEARGSVVDIGCGRGYLLEQIKSSCPTLQLWGVDIQNKITSPGIQFAHGALPTLPFEDEAFDTVLCTHTVEHILQVERAFAELIRITRNRLIIVTPHQRYHYYTFDGHVNFFFSECDLLRYLPLPIFSLKKIYGDWLYVGQKR